MATLTELQDLIQTNDEEIIDNQEEANRSLESIDRNIMEFLNMQKRRRLDDLEDRREKKSRLGLGAGLGLAGAAGLGLGIAGGIGSDLTNGELDLGKILVTMGKVAAGLAASYAAFKTASKFMKGLGGDVDSKSLKAQSDKLKADADARIANAEAEAKRVAAELEEAEKRAAAAEEELKKRKAKTVNRGANGKFEAEDPRTRAREIEIREKQLAQAQAERDRLAREQADIESSRAKAEMRKAELEALEEEKLSKKKRAERLAQMEAADEERKRVEAAREEGARQAQKEQRKADRLAAREARDARLQEERAARTQGAQNTRIQTDVAAIKSPTPPGDIETGDKPKATTDSRPRMAPPGGLSVPETGAAPAIGSEVDDVAIRNAEAERARLAEADRIARETDQFNRRSRAPSFLQEPGPGRINQPPMVDLGDPRGESARGRGIGGTVGDLAGRGLNLFDPFGQAEEAARVGSALAAKGSGNLAGAASKALGTTARVLGSGTFLAGSLIMTPSELADGTEQARAVSLWNDIVTLSHEGGPSKINEIMYLAKLLNQMPDELLNSVGLEGVKDLTKEQYLNAATEFHKMWKGDDRYADTSITGAQNAYTSSYGASGSELDRYDPRTIIRSEESKAGPNKSERFQQLMTQFQQMRESGMIDDNGNYVEGISVIRQRAQAAPAGEKITDAVNTSQNIEAAKAQQAAQTNVIDSSVRSNQTNVNVSNNSSSTDIPIETVDPSTRKFQDMAGFR